MDGKKQTLCQKKDLLQTKEVDKMENEKNYVCVTFKDREENGIPIYLGKKLMQQVKEVY